MECRPSERCATKAEIPGEKFFPLDIESKVRGKKDKHQVNLPRTTDQKQLQIITAEKLVSSSVKVILNA